MKNVDYLNRLVNGMYLFGTCRPLDEYGTRIFGRPIDGSWKLFLYLTRFASESEWKWDADAETASYPRVEVPSYETFVTFILHEVTHGWCYFHKDENTDFTYPTGVDEEQVCWDVSKLVCEMLGVTYDKVSAEQSHLFHKLVQRGDIVGVGKLMDELPAHHQV